MTVKRKQFFKNSVKRTEKNNLKKKFGLKKLKKLKSNNKKKLRFKRIKKN
jgi:hypothetical protein